MKAITKSSRLPLTFQFSLLTLISMAGIILALAEEQSMPVITVALSIIVGLMIVTETHWQLPGWLHTSLGFSALYFAGREFFSGSPEAYLLSGAHLIVYLTWIVLIQTKNDRAYWLLIALGMLQVAVSAVLTKQIWYGFSLLAFLALGMWTLSIFVLHQSVEEFAAARSIVREKRDSSKVWNSLQFDGSPYWFSLRYLGGILTISVLAVLVGGVVFSMVPRVWLANQIAFGNETGEWNVEKPKTGFSESVSLGETGEIHENAEPVMEVAFFENRTGRDRERFLSVEQFLTSRKMIQVYMRGSVQKFYNAGRWSSDDSRDQSFALQSRGNRRGIRLNVQMERLGSSRLFAPGYPLQGSLINHSAERDRRRSVIIDRRSGVISLDFSPQAAIQYHVVIPETQDGMTIEVSPEEYHAYQQSRYIEDMKQVPDELQRLKKLSTRLVQEEQAKLGHRLDRLEATMALMNYLRGPDFAYTLKMEAAQNSADPVEDFLFRRKAGHCEYFASALTLLVRSQGIPARLVNGFAGNDVTSRQTLTLQQRHAHAWVEVMGDDNHWHICDPTPVGGREEAIDEATSNLTLYTRIYDAITGFWSSNVLNVSLEQQQSSLYSPLQSYAERMRDSTLEITANIPLLSSLARQATANRSRWFGTLIVVGLLVIAIAAWLAWLFFRRMLPQIRAWFSRQSDATSTAYVAIEFYERLLRSLKALGFSRTPAQTPAEFVHDVTNTLRSRGVGEELLIVPESVTKLFYRIRYGHGELSQSEASELGNWLEILERHLPQLKNPQLSAT